MLPKFGVIERDPLLRFDLAITLSAGPEKTKRDGGIFGDGDNGKCLIESVRPQASRRY